MMSENSHALVLFARDPVPGQVKTRLHSSFDAETVYNLYIHFLNDSIDKVCEVGGVDRFIGVYPSNVSGFFDRLGERPDIEVFNQEGKDLGERMHRAFSQKQEAGYERTVIMGSDSPNLPVAYVQQAFESDKDIVIGPSSDGGYYLIGMGAKTVDIFAGVAWGTDTVLDETLGRIQRSGASLELLPLWYDVDRPEDLRFLKTHLDMTAYSGSGRLGATGEFLKQLEL